MSSKENKRNLEWGILLITFGLAALMQTLSIGDDWIRTGLIALGGLVGLILFLLDRSDWVLLIPPYILLTAAAISAMALLGYADGDLFASLVLVLVGLPFLVVFLLNRANWWALITAYVLFSIGVLIGLEEFSIFATGDSMASAFFGFISLPFLVVFLVKRTQRWALIPFYVMAVLAVMIPLIETGIIFNGWIATYILSSIALPFLVVFLYKRENLWALIPAYVLLAIGLMIGLIEANVLRDLVIPGYIMLSVAAPFFLVYGINREKRWALIPGSITGVIGLAFLVSSDLVEFVFPAAMILVGLWVLFRGIKK